MLKVVVNGKEFELFTGTKLCDFLISQNLNVDCVFVCINDNIIDSKDYQSTEIKDNDIIDIMSFVAGG